MTAPAIDLRVSLDTSLVEAGRAGGWESVLDRWRSLAVEETLAIEREPGELFHVREPLEGEAGRRLEALARHLAASVEPSVAQVRDHLPAVPEAVRRDLKVVLLPWGRWSFGPRQGLQLFSLHPDADPEEAYLFLVHVYYHEISDLGYTPRCRRCSQARRTAEDFRYWIHLLIRNEGIANHAVLARLLRFRQEHPGYAWRYFSYADRIGDARAVAAGFDLLRRVFDRAETMEQAGRLDDLLGLLKDKMSPVVNLLGIHMATAVVDRFGLRALSDVHGRDAEEFFRLYEKTGVATPGALP